MSRPLTSQGAAIVARGVSKRFAGGLEALQGIDVDVDAGQFVALVGPSGCGKSTLLRLVAGLAEPTGGELTVDGRPPREARAKEGGLAYVLQDPTLLRWRRVAANVALPLQLRRRSSAEIGRRVGAALQLVGLGDMAHLFPHQLSGGMRMRVSIARALATDPRLLLMDEPFGALDEIARQRLNEELLSLWRRCGLTCLFVTHSVQEAVFLSQRVLVMGPRPGRLTAAHDVPFDHPRPAGLRTRPDFGALVEAVSADLWRAMSGTAA